MKRLLVIASAIGCTADTAMVEQSVSSPVVVSSTTPATLAFNWSNNVAIDGRGRVHAVWSEGTGSVSVAYARSFDDGQTWVGPGLFATTSITGTLPSNGVRVAASGDDVYITWTGTYEGYARIYLIASHDAGGTYAAPLPISDAGISVGFPSIAASKGTVAVVWTDQRVKADGDRHNEIYARVSTDEGRTFAPTAPVSVPDHFSSWTPAVAVKGTEIHVAWTDERNDIDPVPSRGIPDCADRDMNCREEEYYRRSLDGGVTWGPEQRLTFDEGEPKSSWAPSIAIWGNTVHVAYFDARTQPWKVYYQRSLTDGATWSLGERVISDPSSTAPAWRPVLSVLGGQVRLVYWQGGYDTGPADVYFAASTDNGASWIGPGALTGNIAAGSTFSASQPQIALSPTGTNHLIWMDDHSGATQIVYLRM